MSRQMQSVQLAAVTPTRVDGHPVGAWGDARGGVHVLVETCDAAARAEQHDVWMVPSYRAVPDGAVFVASVQFDVGAPPVAVYMARAR